LDSAWTARCRTTGVLEELKEHSRWAEEASDSRVVKEDVDVVKVEVASTAEHSRQV